jgi:hypothetical protein
MTQKCLSVRQRSGRRDQLASEVVALAFSFAGDRSRVERSFPEREEKAAGPLGYAFRAVTR